MHPAPVHAAGHYHLSVHTISRLGGTSIQAMAAYRRAARFEAPPSSVTHAAAYQRAQEMGNDGQVFDYRRKVGVAWTGIMAPAFTPKDLLDPQTLWNTVERFESRKNARLGREMIIALPHQVDLTIHVAMLRAFITTHLVSRGMVADVAIHRPPVEHGGDPRNWHAHVLLTDRPMTPQGFAAMKDRMWNAKENLLLWRRAWSDVHNATMEHLGLPHRIDHRSLEAQRQDALARGDTMAALDLDRTPQIHVGKALHADHPRFPVYADRHARNKAILTHNARRAGAHVEHVENQMARADSAAYLEARINALKRDLAQPDAEPLTLAELHARYGRPASVVTRLMAPRITAQAVRTANANGFFFTPPETRSLDILGFLRIASADDQHRPRSLFHVSARDIAFAFYGFGLMTRAELQNSLDADAQLRLNRRVPSPKKAVPLPLPTPPPPKLPTPHADRLAALRKAAFAPEILHARRLAQLAAFNTRHQAHAQTRRATKILRLARLTKRQPPT